MRLAVTNVLAGTSLQVARRVCVTGAELVCKAEQALAPAAASILGASVLYAGLLRRGDVRGAARLAAGHVRAALRWATKATASAWASASSLAHTYTPRCGALCAACDRAAAAPCLRASAQALRQHAAGLRQRTVATARASYKALDPERRLAALATGSQRLPAATCLMLAGGAGLLATAAVLTVHIMWD